VNGCSKCFPRNLSLAMGPNGTFALELSVAPVTEMAAVSA